MTARAPLVFGSDGIPQQLQSGDTLLGAAPLAAYDGRCILALSGTSGTSGATLVLSPCAGNGVVVNGSIVTIPDAGISLAPPSGNTGALYWIYLTPAVALEASTTAPVVQAGTGLKIKGGTSGATDPTRRLVGMAQTGSNGYWYDADAYRYVRSYFNDPGVKGIAYLASNTSQTASAPGLLTNTVSALMWNGEAAIVTSTAVLSSGAANGSGTIRPSAANAALTNAGNGGQSYAAGGQFGGAQAGVYRATADGLVPFASMLAGDGTNSCTAYANAETALLTLGNGVA